MLRVSPIAQVMCYRLALLLSLFAICWFAFSIPSANVVATVNDKVLHIGAFVFLAYLFDGAFPTWPFWKGKFTLLLLYGFFIELVQMQLDYREFSLFDLVADMFGLLVYRAGHKLIWKFSGVFVSTAEAKKI